jgi:hypothetical protein
VERVSLHASDQEAAGAVVQARGSITAAYCAIAAAVPPGKGRVGRTQCRVPGRS